MRGPNGSDQPPRADSTVGRYGTLRYGTVPHLFVEIDELLVGQLEGLNGLEHGVPVAAAETRPYGRYTSSNRTVRYLPTLYLPIYRFMT